MAKRQFSIKRTIDAGAGTIVFQGMDNSGEEPKLTMHRAEFHLDRAHADNVAYAALHGFNQRIGDAAAIEAKDGKYPTLSDKFDGIRKLIAHYESGSAEWDLKAQIGEGTLLFKVLMREKPERDTEKVRAYVAGLSAAAKTDLLLSERLRSIADEIRAERAGTTDLTEVFAELDSL